MNPKAINKLLTVNEVKEMINENKVLVLAGNETVLSQLPKGNWIGGTIPYFMDAKGGTFSKESIFVTDLTDTQRTYKITTYNANEINKIIDDRYPDGFTYLLIPAFSDIHLKYAIEAESIPGLYDAPIFGWITGIDLDELGTVTPKIINGLTNDASDAKAIALHVELPDSKIAQLEIINIFKQGCCDTIIFNEEGFSAKTCFVNGKEVNFTEYIKEKNIDIRLPLVADYSGAMINVSFQQVDEENKEVKFYAPVRKNLAYKIAIPVSDYVAEFTKMVPSQEEAKDIALSCNCILNYLYSELENKQTAGINGPITFGEIAYVLVNQTMVYLSVL